MKDVFLLHVKVFFFFFQNQLDQIVFISRVLVKDLPCFFYTGKFSSASFTVTNTFIVEEVKFSI